MVRGLTCHDFARSGPRPLVDVKDGLDATRLRIHVPLVMISAFAETDVGGEVNRKRFVDAVGLDGHVGGHIDGV
jgi:hypothetical protein